MRHIMNKTTWKRRMAAMLACVMLTGLLAGCATGADLPAKPVPAQEDTAANVSQEEEHPGQEEGDVTKISAEWASESDLYGADAESFMLSDDHISWWENYGDRVDASLAAQEGETGVPAMNVMDDFYRQILFEMMGVEQYDDLENRVCSPLNIYIALAMLAECADGNTRQQITDLLHADDADTLRTRIDALWHANYAETPVLTSLLGNSLWMNDEVGYNPATIDLLATKYMADVFSGQMGTPAMDDALRQWTNAHTGDLLTQYTEGMQTDPSTILALVSTIYYKASWMDEFYKEATEKETFHGASGDAEVDMMHAGRMRTYYHGDGFGAVALALMDSGAMYLFLPDEGVDVKEVAGNLQTIEIARSADSYDLQETLIVNLSVPKFNIHAQTDLTDVFKRLGITDAFAAERADFTPLLNDERITQTYVSSAEHAAMVEIDEDGVTGAAYTEMMIAAGAAALQNETMDFVVDRPFYFIITGRDQSILFAGVVQDIEP